MENQVATANLSESEVLFLVQTAVNRNEGQLKSDRLKLAKIQVHVSQNEFAAGKKYKVWLIPGVNEHGNDVSYIVDVEKDGFGAPRDYHFSIIREYNVGEEIKVQGETMKVVTDGDGFKKIE